MFFLKEMYKNSAGDYEPVNGNDASNEYRLEIRSLQSTVKILRAILIALSILAILPIGMCIYRPPWKSYSSIPSTPGVPDAITNTMVSRLWMQDDRFALDRHDSESDAAWKTFDSRFVWIKDPAQYGLPPSTKGPDGHQIYSVAAYHQLHCTGVMRHVWHALVENGTTILDDPYPGLEKYGDEGYTMGGHFGHCLEIVRQALVCSADATLEPLLADDGITHTATLASGWGTQHTCKDLDKLTAWIDEYYH